MKKVIFAVFSDIDVADQAINHLHNELKIPNDEISYVYKDKTGHKVSGEGDDVASKTAGEGAATGATTGGLIGAAVGVIGVVGLLGPLGPVVVAGPMATFLGISGATGVIIGTGVAGAAIGGLVGALTSMGVSEPQARKFEERVEAGEVLMSVHAEDAVPVTDAFKEFNAQEITVIEENT